MYRFLLKPRWLLSHLLVLALVVLMINLGFWQLRRLDEKQTLNATIENRSDLATEPIDQVVLVDDSTDVGEEVAYRRVTATGTYDAENIVAVRNRSLDGTPGFWILTPLVLDDGTAVVVNRGWVPFAVETDATDIEFDTPEGEVSVSGLLFESVSPAKVSDNGRTTLGHVDIGWLRESLPEALYPVYIQMEQQSPAQASDLPQPVAAPELDDGPHLSYAVQWFIFTTIAVVGYPIILARLARQRSKEQASPIDLRDDQPLPV